MASISAYVLDSVADAAGYATLCCTAFEVKEERVTNKLRDAAYASREDALRAAGDAGFEVLLKREDGTVVPKAERAVNGRDITGKGPVQAPERIVIDGALYELHVHCLPDGQKYRWQREGH